MSENRKTEDRSHRTEDGECKAGTPPPDHEPRVTGHERRAAVREALVRARTDNRASRPGPSSASDAEAGPREGGGATNDDTPPDPIPRTCAYYTCGKWYAGRTEKGKWVLMHRQIMNPPKGKVVDHKDRNGLDNSREDLRIGTYGQNNCNRTGRSDRGEAGTGKRQKCRGKRKKEDRGQGEFHSRRDARTRGCKTQEEEEW